MKPAGRVLEFAFVDVFAERPLTGNPLAVVPDADDVDVSVMRVIAREFNQSETTFLMRSARPDVQWRLRSFTPDGSEVGGAGHNALGAWLWLVHAGRVDGGTFMQEIGEDVLAVQVVVSPAQPPRIAMRQSAPEFGAVVDDRRLAASLGLDDGDLDASLPAQVVSTGVGHLLVALRDRRTVDRSDPDPRALLDVLRASGGEGCYVYTTAGPESGEADGVHAYSRFFNPTVGIAEDPATGTAAGPLAAALVRAGHVPDGTTVQIEQGTRLGRPSRIRIEVSGDSVELSGSGLVVAEGRLSV